MDEEKNNEISEKWLNDMYDSLIKKKELLQNPIRGIKEEKLLENTKEYIKEFEEIICSLNEKNNEQYNYEQNIKFKALLLKIRDSWDDFFIRLKAEKIVMKIFDKS